MDIEQWIELGTTLRAKKNGEKEDLEKLQKLFERFHLLNRKYLDKEAFEKARESVPSIVDAVANTFRYLDDEIARLRSKRMKLPFENLELTEMQKVQAKNEALLKDYLASVKE